VEKEFISLMALPWRIARFAVLTWLSCWEVMAPPAHQVPLELPVPQALLELPSLLAPLAFPDLALPVLPVCQGLQLRAHQNPQVSDKTSYSLNVLA